MLSVRWSPGGRAGKHPAERHRDAREGREIHMRVNRRLLAWGVFLLALGGVLVAADLRTVDTALLADIVRLWPLAVLAIGLAMVLRKTSAALPLALAAALLPGVVLGAALAVAPRFSGDCGSRGEPQPAALAEGTFTGRAAVTVRSGCGSLAISTAPGDAWRLDARNTAARAPIVEPGENSLAIRHAGQDDLFDAGRDAWDLTLPAERVDSLSVVTLAGNSRIALPGAQLDELALTANASNIVVDAADASIAELSGRVNVGSLAIQLPGRGFVTGTLRVGAGALRLCSAPGAGLDVSIEGTAGHVTVGGVEWEESHWNKPGYELSSIRASLEIHVNFGAIEIDPIGGCS
jgi:hypothetical protein